MVRIEIERGAGVPLSILAVAKAMRDENAQKGDPNSRYDQVWCVFDVDDHPNLNQALQEAHDAGLKLAVSNESFELWLVLHFQDNPGMMDRKNLRRNVKKHVPNYDKHVNIEDFLPGYTAAVQRAKRMWEDACNANEFWKRNPVTTVYQLTEAIRGEQ